MTEVTALSPHESRHLHRRRCRRRRIWVSLWCTLMCCTQVKHAFSVSLSLSFHSIMPTGSQTLSQTSSTVHEVNEALYIPMSHNLQLEPHNNIG